jgi:metal-responsive CopG/Arc/MetJ family transcriptional regulator
MQQRIGLRIMIIIDRELLKKIDSAAKKAKLNRSAFLRAAAEAKLNA